MRIGLALLAVTAAASASTPSLAAHSSAYGRILFDGRGHVLYAFTRDTKAHSACAGACAKAWPPYLVSTRPRALAGIKQSLIGTTRRADGRLQATYRGRPLYFYVGDRKPGQILCQNVTEFGGRWLVLRPDGVLVRSPG
jgi:predicted lipoprotein with Yx(FWY)xxD motif